MSSSDPSEIQPRQLLQTAADFFDSYEIDYRVVDSMASIAYGEIRFTNDIDIVADLSLRHVDSLCDHFRPPEYFLARHAVEDAIRRRFQFNIIHVFAGLKLDVFLHKASDYAAMESQRARRLTDPDGLSAVFASPEDVIINKLLYFKSGGSEKHLRDIAGILKVKATTIDVAYLNQWAAKLSVNEEWESLKDRLSLP